MSGGMLSSVKWIMHGEKRGWSLALLLTDVGPSWSGPGEWKYIHFQDFPPQLFDLKKDPQERSDLGRDSSFRNVCREMEGRLSAWLTERKIRTTITNETVEQRTGTAKERGYLFGVW